MMPMAYDMIIVGTGPAGAFFLHRALSLLPKDTRILVLERGELRDHQWHIQNRATWMERHRNFFVNRNDRKDWIFNLAFGGTSNCWYGVTPRMLPNDFKLNSLYGVGYDWPLSYDDLEPYYGQAEEIMAISGSNDWSPTPRARSYKELCDAIEKSFLLSSDFFYYEAKTNRTVNYVGYYDPWERPCSNPFASLKHD